MELANGDIILIKKNKFNTWYERVLAKAIQLFDGCYYHHAQMYFDDKIWEANKTIEANEVSTLKGHEIIVLRPNRYLDYSEEINIRRQLDSYLGQKYDYAGTMLHQLLYILSLRRVWIGRTGKKARKRMYCTEFVTTIMHDTRGYFPEKHKIGPYKLLILGPLYYHAVFEGEVK